jgi:rhamnosyltransferase
LLASRNGAEYIRAQLDSILAQRGVSVEVLIGDDASSDATLDVIRSLNAAGTIRVVRRATGSGSAAQNFARLFREANLSNFDYVALSDQDDIWLPGKLRRAVDMLTTRHYGGYSCSVIARWPNGRESVVRQCPKLRDADFLFEGGGQGCSFVTTSTLFSIVQQIFQARQDLTAQLIYHDWAVYALARTLGVPWVFDTEPFIVYRQHGANDTGTRGSVAGLRRRLRLFLDRRYQAQVSAIAHLCLEASPENRILHRWVQLESRTNSLSRRLGKAAFCFRHGRRRRMDRLLTAIAALAGWL